MMPKDENEGYSYRFVSAHSPLRLCSFSLDEKGPKNQVRKNLPRARPDSLSRFSDRPLPAFLDARCLIIASPSAGPLRAKAGKMMPALCGCRGVRNVA